MALDDRAHRRDHLLYSDQAVHAARCASDQIGALSSRRRGRRAGVASSALIDPHVRIRRSRLIDLPLLCFLLAIVGSDIVNSARVSTVAPDVVKGLLFFVSFVAILFLVVSLLRSFDDIDFVVRVLIAGGAVVAFFALVESRTGYNVFAHLSQIVPVLRDTGGGAVIQRGSRLRVYGSAEHPIALGAVSQCLFRSHSIARFASSRSGGGLRGEFSYSGPSRRTPNRGSHAARRSLDLRLVAVAGGQATVAARAASTCDGALPASGHDSVVFTHRFSQKRAWLHSRRPRRLEVAVSRHLARPCEVSFIRTRSSGRDFVRIVTADDIVRVPNAPILDDRSRDTPGDWCHWCRGACLALHPILSAASARPRNTTGRSEGGSSGPSLRVSQLMPSRCLPMTHWDSSK